MAITVIMAIMAITTIGTITGITTTGTTTAAGTATPIDIRTATASSAA
jgi:hypothetical protein